MLLCGMNFINLIRIQFIFGIEDQLILSYNPKTAYIYAKITTDFLFIVSVWDIC